MRLSRLQSLNSNIDHMRCSLSSKNSPRNTVDFEAACSVYIRFRGVNGYLNTEVVNLFLEQFARELPAGVHAVLIWDGAGFHTGEDVVVPSNVSLIQLPPYSPELNPVENLWHYLRAYHWSNRPYRDYDALQEEAVRSLCAVREDIETIKTVCNPRY